MIVVIGSTPSVLPALTERARSAFEGTGAVGPLRYLVQYGGTGPDPGTESAPGHFYSPGTWKCAGIYLGLPMFDGPTANAVFSYCLDHLGPGGQFFLPHRELDIGQIAERRRRSSSVFAWYIENHDRLTSSFDGPLKQQNDYLLSGVLLKSPRILDIAGAMGTPLNGRIVDIGGAFGYVGAEISLSGFQEVVNVEVNRKNLSVCTALSSFLHENSVEYTFVEKTVEQFSFPENNSIVMFLGSLLYVDIPLRTMVLHRAFMSLRERGILIVHENIRSAKFDVRTQALMFEPLELDSLLTCLGKVRYFSIDRNDELPAELVGRQTVYRVVQK